MPAAGRYEGSPAGSLPDAAASRPRVGIVVAGQGSVTPVEAYAALREDYRPVFLVAPGPGGGTEPAKLAAALDALARRAEVHRLPADRAVLSSIGELHGVTTFCADGVPVALELAGRLGLPALAGDGGGRSPHDTGRSLYDKAAQRIALGAGLNPRFVALPQPCRVAGAVPHEGCDRREWERAAARVGLPAVLKPARGQASRGVRRIAGVADLLAAHDAIASAGSDPATQGTGWLLEEFLTGPDRWPRAGYVSVESVVSGSRIRHLALTRKLPMAEPFREVGQYLLPGPAGGAGDTADDAALFEATTDALVRLRVAHAVTHTELIVTADGPKVVEVNARVGGLVRDLVKAAHGVDLARVAAAVAVGGPDRLDDAGEVSGLVFQYAPLAPIQAAEFRQAYGIDAVVSLAGVDKYLPHVAAGELLAGGTETVTLGVFSGTCRDEEELAAVLTELERLVSYEFLLCPEGKPARCDARGRML